MEEVNDQLTAHAHIDPSDVELKVQNGEVTLTGTVDDRQAKQLAEDVAENVAGVTEVINQIRIRRASQSGGRAAEPSSKTSKTGS
jgi:osmotically-inducible protein OsmY